jgi:hypothetical protein
LRNVINAGRDAMDAGRVETNAPASGRRSRVVLVSSIFLSPLKTTEMPENKDLFRFPPSEKRGRPNNAGPNRP